jgi:hypothetical protein
MTFRTLALTLLLAVAGVQPARADGWFGRDTVQGVADLRLVAGEGLTAWTARGFGKAGFGGTRDGVATRLTLANLEAVWRPELADGLSLVVDAVSQPNATRGIDAAESYLLWHPAPRDGIQLQARAGLLYPPISLEHVETPGEPWIVRDILTPSAINSWVGEELRTVGGEIRGRAPADWIGDGARLDGTVALFGGNDTSGTLLSFRGWTLDDRIATTATRWALPPLNRFMRRPQASVTKPLLELDRRAGWYGRLGLELSGGASVSVFWYDNNGDRRAVDKRQWSWDTKFLALGVVLPVGGGASLSSQFMEGRTAMGFHRGATYWVDAFFQSFYLALSERRGPDTLTARLDAFRVRNRPLPVPEDYGESGTAGLMAWKHAFDAAHDGLLEIVRTDWRRPSMAGFGLSPRQSQTTLQASWRTRF